MSTASNRARAKLAAKRVGRRHRTSRSRRGTPSTAPYEAALAMTGDDIGDLQKAIDDAPGPDLLADLDRAASELERPRRVTLSDTCPHCGHSVTLRDYVTFPALVSVAGRLRAIRAKLADFDPRVLQRMIDSLGEGASLWWTGKGG